ncbi:MAG: HypC/HybG/HupF family hydrogenase formation chaperone [Nanoarchaeota archaeon]
MCLAVPGKITEIKSEIATVDYGAEKRKGKLIGKNYKKGDYVIVQGGVVVQKVDKREAMEALKMYQRFLRE